MTQEKVVSLRNVSKVFTIRENQIDSMRDRVFQFLRTNEKRKIYSLKNISLQVYKGEFFSIIGANGSGKSTLLNIIMGSIVPTTGEVFTKGKILRLALGMGFDPGLSARENIYINASVLGLTFREIGRRFSQIVSFAGIEEFIDTPVKFYSSGMKSRLTFAIAVEADADILLIDEFFGGVGDKEFKDKSSRVFEERVLSGKTIIHVNHNLNLVSKYSDRVAILSEGNLVKIGDPSDVVDYYKEYK